MPREARVGKAHEVRARIRLCRADEGGRRGPIGPRYHAMVRFPGNEAVNDAVLLVEGGDGCAPGAECAVRLRFLSPEAVQPFLRVGGRFDLREGARLIGEGVIAGIL